MILIYLEGLLIADNAPLPIEINHADPVFLASILPDKEDNVQIEPDGHIPPFEPFPLPRDLILVLGLFPSVDEIEGIGNLQEINQKKDHKIDQRLEQKKPRTSLSDWVQIYLLVEFDEDHEVRDEQSPH